MPSHYFLLCFLEQGNSKCSTEDERINETKEGRGKWKKGRRRENIVVEKMKASALVPPAPHATITPVKSLHFLVYTGMNERRL